MTDETKPSAQRQPVRQKLDPASDSKLALLLTSFHEAKCRADAAAAEADEYQSQIAGMLSEVSEGVDAFDIAADPHGGYPAFTYRWTPEGKGFDSQLLKSEDPAMWEKYAKPRKGYWTFEKKRNGRGKR